jgi:hypothetical protein
VFSGHYVPPAPGPSSPPGPTLSLNVSGTCPGCVATAVGTGFHPNSSITLFVDIISPPLGSVELPGFAITDAGGSWTFEGDITATDEEGASASGRLTAECVAP